MLLGGTLVRELQLFPNLDRAKTEPLTRQNRTRTKPKPNLNSVPTEPTAGHAIGTVGIASTVAAGTCYQETDSVSEIFMLPQSAQSPRHSSSPGIARPVPEQPSTLEHIQVKLVEALHEMQKGASPPVPGLSDSIRYVQKALTLIGDPNDRTELGPVDGSAFAARLYERRIAARMSQELLAEKSMSPRRRFAT